MPQPRSFPAADLSFISLATLALVVLLIGVSFLPSPPLQQPETIVGIEKSTRFEERLGYPDKFAEHFAAVQGIYDGYTPYPPGHKIREFQKALLTNAKRGKISTGLNWIERGPGNVGGRSRAIVPDPSDQNTWFIATVGGGVWRARRSVAFGLEKLDWTPLTDHLPSLSATTLDISRNNPNVIYFGTGEGVLGVSSSSGVGMFRSTDKGENWTHLSATSVSYDEDWRFVNRIAVHPDNPNIVVAVTNGAIFRTEDGGESFSKVLDLKLDLGLGGVQGPRASTGRVQDLKANRKDFNLQFAAVNRLGILKSTDGGKSWNTSLTGFVYGAERIELAISESDPNVIWASVEGTGARRNLGYPIADLYRSVDNGNSWHLVEIAQGTFPEATVFLGAQGWYDNSITVHPFSPDTVYLGGIFRWKAWINPGGEELELRTVILNKRAPFLSLYSFGQDFAAGRVGGGHLDEAAEEITEDEMSSVEIRFGPGLTQMAHRFTVPPNSERHRDWREEGIPYPGYTYADYVEVPFQAWDTDNDRQLMVSFRDQGNDGAWNLIHSNVRGLESSHSRELTFISKYDYDASSPKPEYTEKGGFAKGLMYSFWPYLHPDQAEWDPSSSPDGVLDIDVIPARGVYRTTELWENGNVHVDHHDLRVIPIEERMNEFHILNANDGGIAYSRDGGYRWFQGDATAGFNTSQFYDATKRPSGQEYLGGTQDNGTYRSSFSPSNRQGWAHVLGGDGFDVIWKGADSLMGSIQFNYILRSINGLPWEVAGNIQGFDGQFLTTLGWTPESKDVVFTISPTSGLLRSLDFGGSWHIIPLSDYGQWRTPLRGGGKVRVSLADPSVVWAGNRFTQEYGGITLHVSENALDPVPGDGVDHPVRTRAIPPPSFTPSARIAGLATHPFDRATAYVTFAVPCFPKVIRTEDMGDTWEDLSGFVGVPETVCESTNGFPDAQVWDIEVFPNTPSIIWAATDMGIFESHDDGETWAYADNGLPAVSVWRIRIVDDEIILATHGRGVWTLNIDQINTDTDRIAHEIPDSFKLLDNYPNPFNPTTTVNFKVASESHIRVTVFDMLGRKVAILTDQPYAGGIHQIQWDASAMGSGQYLYRMEADDKVIDTKSMILVK
ncbi:MAG: T9SS type A sorting domain-containing protein [Rhodothermaceae bacterium]|nr:T9SS type A sorting domain-containing protein [Rhodothermaceae bacterium]MXZ58012.1 T9SS type A sorting domain-containing protein [Rhodothermaceae bacterium]MYB91516.1 T9SS type A sorting domain-containing protein [Rhodothermaceae bacterium]MYD69061.1 T9SS type A sorting domain-containing protein [Rhodothermaceae bacterium]MYG43627.1 T9SS type A sorting domain-containing protein [Rhodothermaceae bacterium]